MSAETHAQQFNKNQLRTVLSGDMHRFKLGNDKCSDFALTKAHPTLVPYRAKLKIKIEEPCNSGDL